MSLGVDAPSKTNGPEEGFEILPARLCAGREFLFDLGAARLMRISGLLAHDWLRPSKTKNDRRRSIRAKKPGSIEMLEGRQLLTTAVAGVDYALNGFSWSNPAHITYSIAPDGVFWDHGTNDLNAVLDSKIGPGTWEKAIAQALATWESVANINISLTSDSYNDLNTLGLSQGDPRFGDIRFGGYAFANDTTTLAQTYYPPPNGSTESGDVEVNTSLNWHSGSDYDLFSVMLHETGHSLGLDHATNPADVMYASYQGVRTGLGTGDIAGIQVIYGARTPDAYTSQGTGVSFASAIDATPTLNANGQSTISGVSLATIGATEYYRVVAPSQASGTFQVTAAANSVSMLSPKVTLYDASGNVIQSQANPNAWSDNVSVATPAVVPGATYYIAVTGATSDVFAIGAYNLRLSFSGIPVPVTTPTPTPTPDPTSGSGSNSGTTTGSGSNGGGSTATSPPPVVAIAPDRFESNDTIATATALGNVTRTIVGNLNLNTGSDVDVFSFRNPKAGVYTITAYGTSIRVVDGTGRLLATGDGALSVRVARARTTVYVEMSSSNGAPLSDYGLSIAAAKAQPRVFRTARATIARQLAAASVNESATVAPQALPSGPTNPAWWLPTHKRTLERYRPGV